MVSREAPFALQNSIQAWLPGFDELQGAIVAGGFIRAYYAGETPSDMDLYFETEECFAQAYEKLIEWEWKEVAFTDRAVTFVKDGKTVQLIKYIFGIPQEIIEAFDFTVCAIAVNITADDAGELWKEVMHDNFFEHLAGRVLVFTGSPLPLASLKRAFKYVKRGYSICDENLVRIIEAINQAVNFEDEESVAKHMAGMDPDGERRIRVID
ncbi:MAG: hypothetical protein H0Z35_09070 [Thermoanaerobacteraceae bacterium]|nr:hypothetical protein [Thermoanaerobacteraceae bacterium]